MQCDQRAEYVLSCLILIPSLPSLMFIDLYISTGTRYKDGSRIDFDLCSTCEASSAGEAGGPWLKITTPDKAPALLICVSRGGHAPPGMGGWGRCGGGRGGRGAWRRAAYRAHQQQEQQQQQQQEATAAEGAATTGATTDTGAQTSTSFADQMEQAIHASLTTPSPAAATSETTEAPITEATTTEASTTEATTTEATEEPATVTESAATDVDSAITAAAAAGATTGDNSDSEYDILETTPLLEETATTTDEENATTTTANTAAITEQQQQQRAKRWQKEIVSLASMGFVDFALNLDLLEQHVGTPGGAGMDKVLDQLLSA
jgi:hypothetical protein